MSSQILVVDEWLIHDLRGDNNNEARNSAYRFLSKVIEICDRLAVLQESPWAEKAWDLMRHTDLPTRPLSKLLHSILWNQNKAILVGPEDLNALPSELMTKIPEKDLYLVQLYFTAKADLLITTDGQLHRQLSQIPAVRVNLKQEFLAKYLDE